MRRTGLLALVVMLFVLAGCGTAALLPDGRVLLLNGIAKEYDPATGAVTNLPAPPTTRLLGTATTLNNGLVLLAGGVSSFSTGLTGSGDQSTPTTFASAELYDPKTGTYTPTGSMAHPRAFHTATLLSDGRVLILGGGESTSSSGTSGSSTPQQVPPPEIYDPASGTFSPTAGDTLIPHVWSTATLLQDGKVLITGGGTAAEAGATPAPGESSPPTGQVTDEAELFDPSTGTFSATGSMTRPRVWHTATLLADGKVLIVGGTLSSDLGASSSSGPADTTPQTAEIYDPASGTFSATGAPGAPRMWHAATLLPDGHVLVTGGLNQSGAGTGADPFLKSAELFDPAAGTFSATGDMVEGQALHTSTLLQDGKVLIAGLGAGAISGATGGGSSGDTISTAQVYDPAAGTFSAVQVEPAPVPSGSPGAGIFG
jgi:Galactose oxidase, central domain